MFWPIGIEFTLEVLYQRTPEKAETADGFVLTSAPSLA